ncbi:hypothetical protein [Actinokineospora sp.]|uniref:hypothetical protein n=1 Tax=Actinokineospora sp. TaxID=1872133 RepID=UPI003D6A4BDE
MSPVSRGRKPKKSAKSKKSAKAVLRRYSAPVPKRPRWFDQATATAMARADTLTAATSPRDLDNRTAELLGEQLHWALHEIRRDLRFGQWFTELGSAALGASADTPSAALLFHGLRAMTSADAAADAARDLPTTSCEGLPSWAAATGDYEATGEVVKLRDAYGTRFGFVASYRYPGGQDPHTYLFDVDTSFVAQLVGGGLYDDVDQAVAAWRAAVGAAADSAKAEAVTSFDGLQCLIGFSRDLMGDESREVMREWLRATDRLSRLTATFDTTDSPTHRADRDHAPMAAEFTDWHVTRFGAPPHPDGLDILASEWVQGAEPETRYAASPERLRTHAAVISDLYYPDDVRAALGLMPTWSTWLAERAGLPDPLRADLLAAAELAAVRTPLVEDGQD